MKEKKSIKLLRVTTVTHSLFFLLKGQMKHMQSQGFSVDMASSYGPEVPELEAYERCQHHEIVLSRTLSPFKDLISLLSMVKLVMKLKPDIIHTHSPKAGIIGMLAGKLCGVKLKVHTVAGLPLMEEKGFKRKLLEVVEKITYKCADYVLPNSLELERFIVNHKLIDKKDKLKVIGKGSTNGIDLSYFNRSETVLSDAVKLKELYEIRPDDIVLCFVGRLTNYKGINELVQAFQMLSNKFPNLKLLLVGPLEALNPLTDKTLNIMNGAENIIATGHQEDIRPFLAMADIFVFPSYREGFPQSLMQASAMGLPCVASNINGCNEIVFDQVNGLLIAPKSVEDIVNACELLISSEDLRSRLSINGRNYMMEHFEQKKVWAEISIFYHDKLRIKNGL